MPVGGKTMLKLIKNIHVYSPEDMGVKDVLIAANKICRISDEIKIASSNKALQKKAPFHNSKNNILKFCFWHRLFSFSLRFLKNGRKKDTCVVR